MIANFGKLHLYQSKLLDAQFTLLYLFINIGSFIGTLAVGFLAEKYNFSVGFIIAGVLFLLSILTVRNTKKEKNILLEYKFVPKNKKLIYVIFVFLLIAFFWVSHNISLIKFYDIDLMFKRSLSSNIPKNILSQFELIYFIPISFILYYLWSKFYYNRLYKIASAFIFAAISFSIILILEDDLIQSNVTLYLLSLFFLYLSEAHIAPVIHSTLTQHLNSKYLASFISVSFIPTALMTMLVYSFHEKIYENNILPLYVGIIGMSISAIIILAIMYMRKTKVNKSFH